MWHSYKSYLRSDVWKEKKEVALKKASYRCQVCNSDQRPEVHHRKYPAILGKELTEDLTVLCKKCHELYTFKIQKPPIELYEKTNKKFVEPTDAELIGQAKRWGRVLTQEMIDKKRTSENKIKKIQKARKKNLKDMRKAITQGEEVRPYQLKAIELNSQMKNFYEDSKNGEA